MVNRTYNDVPGVCKTYSKPQKKKKNFVGLGILKYSRQWLWGGTETRRNEWDRHLFGLCQRGTTLKTGEGTRSASTKPQSPNENDKPTGSWKGVTRPPLSGVGHGRRHSPVRSGPTPARTKRIEGKTKTVIVGGDVGKVPSEKQKRPHKITRNPLLPQFSDLY